MSRLLTALPVAAFGGPVLAHTGPHLHPHGIDALWLVGVGALALAGGYVIGRGRR